MTTLETSARYGWTPIVKQGGSWEEDGHMARFRVCAVRTDISDFDAYAQLSMHPDRLQLVTETVPPATGDPRKEALQKLRFSSRRSSNLKPFRSGIRIAEELATVVDPIELATFASKRLHYSVLPILHEAFESESSDENWDLVVRLKPSQNGDTQSAYLLDFPLIFGRASGFN
ncbi:hypothetical protein ARMSODRAFT_1027876 [Armillaria solidipes]|uniref:Uncharacterized protein n=1 Tax=Armillaria solidipes TaxID=1076256 RepID=A0A2H3AJ49_9AGAR|nr:hypothetical protein ARMSODRAFT_1027876 [Armillaria solidipes]